MMREILGLISLHPDEEIIFRRNNNNFQGSHLNYFKTTVQYILNMFQFKIEYIVKIYPI
uniref:Uncharacterized protein n=1 Tax=Heterorhabditis bacteriophora TaxID=37862 RepID=A0A1I7WQL8_HETBA